MNKLTPGPWIAEITRLANVPPEQQYVTVHNGSVSICKMTGSEGHCHLAMPDALLIAAAPDLLAERDRLRRRVKQLEEALQPFADAAENAVESSAPDHPRGTSQWNVDYDDLEAAYAVMCVAGKRVK